MHISAVLFGQIMWGEKTDLIQNNHVRVLVNRDALSPLGDGDVQIKGVLTEAAQAMLSVQQCNWFLVLITWYI